MNLLYKPDWDEVRPRYEAWWRHEEIDGPLIAVTAPRTAPPHDLAQPAPPINPRQQWLDIDHRLAVAGHRFAATHYAGDAFPWFDTNLGPGSLAVHLGSRPVVAPDTVWYEPCLDSLAGAQLPRINPRETYLSLNLDMARAAMQQLAGKALVSFPDLIENLDTLAALRGNVELLEELADHPDDVLRLQEQALERYFEAYSLFEPIIRDRDGGTVFSAFHIWGQGRTAKLQCDMSCMIGRAMFNRFVAPYLERQAQRLDRVLYHLDGVDAVQHLDTLCALEGIDAIQWTPGAGRPDPGDPCWRPIYRRILDSGKSAQALGVPPHRVRPMLRELGCRGLMIWTWASCEQEADELVQTARATGRGCCAAVPAGRGVSVRYDGLNHWSAGEPACPSAAPQASNAG